MSSTEGIKTDQSLPNHIPSVCVRVHAHTHTENSEKATNKFLIPKLFPEIVSFT